MEFDWDAANVEHVQAHGVTPEEAAETFSSFRLKTKEQEIDGEARSVFLGQTATGQILVVVYAVRNGKIRVVTAFSAKRKLRRLYMEAQNAQEAGS